MQDSAKSFLIRDLLGDLIHKSDRNEGKLEKFKVHHVSGFTVGTFFSGDSNVIFFITIQYFVLFDRNGKGSILINAVMQTFTVFFWLKNCIFWPKIGYFYRESVDFLAINLILSRHNRRGFKNEQMHFFFIISMNSFNKN